MSGNKTPILSKKRQNTSISGRKKPLKTIKNALSSTQANYWPVVNNDERNEIANALKEFNDTIITSIEKKLSSTSNSIEKSKAEKAQIRDLLKFGINQIHKSIKSKICAVVLLEDDLPYVLVAHILRLAIDNSIPLLCIKGFSSLINSYYGFNSSSACFTVKAAIAFPKIINIATPIWNNYPLQKDCDDHINETPKTNSTIPEKCHDSDTKPESSFSKDFIEFSNKNTPVMPSTKRKSKNQLSFQPLLIKRIKNNPNR